MKLSFFQIIKEVFYLIPFKGKVRILSLLPLILLSSFAELLSISIFPIYLSVLLYPNSLSNYKAFNKVIDSLSSIFDLNNLTIFTIVFCLTVLVAGFLRVLLIRSNTTVLVSIGNDFSIKMFKHLTNKSYLFFQKLNTSEIHAIMFKTNLLVNNALEPFVNIITNITLSIFILIALLYINPFIAISTFLLLAIIYSCIILLIRKVISINSHTIADNRGPYNKVIQECFGGIREVILTSSQNIYIKLIEKNLIPIQIAEGKNRVYGSTPRVLIETIGVVALSSFAFLLYSGDNLNFTSIVPVLGSLALGFQKLLPLVQQIYSNILITKAAKQSIIDCINTFNDDSFELIQSLDNNLFNNFSAIKAEKLCFAYDSNSEVILENVNFVFKRNQTIGIIGASGAGKSTLLDLIMGLLSPSGGDLHINNIPLSNENCKSWYSQLSHVPQSIFLMDDTISRNIAFSISDSDIDYNQLEKVIELACLTETIKKLPKGIDTQIGERGVNLSGGQCQRIGIARALYQNKNILILDEATSALDFHTEEKIINNIENMNNEMLVIIVSHRINSLKKCSRIIEIKNKSIIEH